MGDNIRNGSHGSHSLFMLFSHLAPRLQEHLNQIKHSRNFLKKQILFAEGSTLNGIYIVQSGRVKVYKTGPEGRQHILRLAEPGHVMGLESLYSEDHFWSTAEMLEDGEVYFIEKKDFLELAQRHPELSMKVLRLLAYELEESEAERVELAQSSVRERMARLLSLLTDSYGSPCSQGIRINLALSREELAEMAGTVAETAMRLLKDFREEKVLCVQGRDIIVTNQEKLKEVANLELPDNNHTKT